MGTITIAWAFGSFLLYKIVIDASFRVGISALAAGLAGICTAIIIMTASGLYAWRLLDFNTGRHVTSVRKRAIVGRTWVRLIGILALNFIALKLIIFGFSKDFHRYFQYKEALSEQNVGLFLISAIPVVLHYTMCGLGTYVSARSFERRHGRGLIDG